jgi:Tfp pilus assembly protein PilN
MINLLPPSIKQELVYSKRNAILVSYLYLLILVGILGVGGLIGAAIYMQKQTATAEQSLQDKQQQISAYSKLEKTAKTAGDRLTAIETIQKNELQFSKILDNLTAVTPVGVAISAITLTGDTKHPIQITAQTANYQAGLAFRNALVKSPQISGADIDHVSGNEVVVIVGMKPEAVK